MDEYVFTIGGKEVTLTDAQLAGFDAMIQQGAVPPQVPTWAAKAVNQWKKHMGDNGRIYVDPETGKVRYDDGGATSLVPRPAVPGAVRAATPGALPTLLRAPMKKSNNASWFHTITGTGSQANQEIKPNDPIELTDLDITSDDATARLNSIKQGSTELVNGSGVGILISTWRTAFYRAMFAGLVVDRNNPLVVSVTHAGSGTNISTFNLIGFKSKNGGCDIAAV